MSVTLKDIAKETGLSVATISKYINGATLKEQNRVAIERAIKKLGYTVNEYARGLKSKKSRTVGVVIPELSNLFITQIITKMEKILRSQNYSVMICDCHTDKKLECDAVKFLLGKMVDGIINMPVDQEGKHLLPALEKGIPVLLIDRIIPKLKNVDSVVIDNARAADEVVSLLLEQGHRRIGIIVGPQDIYTSRQRKEGYKAALNRYGIKEDERLIVYSDYTLQGGYESMRKLLQDDNGMTAVFVTNYEMTLGAIIAINECGIRIPGELSFIGFDNQNLSRVVHPPLTIVTQPLEEIGVQAANVILSRLTGKNTGAAMTVTLSTQIQQGSSVLPLNG